MLLGLLLAAGAAGLGFFPTKKFVHRRLRFVDVIHSPAAPIVAGATAALVAAVPVAILPIIGAGTALAFGAGVAGGVAVGRKGE